MNFESMLDSVYKDLEKTFVNKKLVVAKPEIIISSTNTYWKNIKKILKQINRDPDHFLIYLNNEINNVNWLTNSKSDGLVIIGKYKKDKINNLLKKYITTYVICSSCNTSYSYLIKDKTIKKYKFICNNCNSTYFVN